MVFNIKTAKRFERGALRDIAKNKAFVFVSGRKRRILYNKSERAIARKVLRMRRR